MSEAGTTPTTGASATQTRRNARAMIVTEDTLRQLRDRERGVNELAGLMAMQFGVLTRQRDAAVAGVNAANAALVEANRAIQALRVELAAALAKVPAEPVPEPEPEPEPAPEPPAG